MALGALIAVGIAAAAYWTLATAWRELGRIDQHAEENDA